MCIRDRTRRTAYCDKGYRTGRATHSVCSGKWCFEITVDNPRELKHARDPGTPTEPHIRVGWCSSKFRLEAPVGFDLSLIHISEPTRLLSISYAVFCLKKKKKKATN
eukprot:TRINITY_DN22229_c0_g1_i2.p1 TRINITY_DN22229_c0_g1~~TRINITY_DN22229_c0_g1_i2.p1  ORF type:complete len:107 (-),score=33.77 TRINITY_DN22229_c0_g1_i2:58-378(-)